MKIGDKVYCKSNFEYHLNNFKFLDCFEIVDININYGIRFISIYNEKENYTFKMRENHVTEQFYTNIEFRKFKLKKLNDKKLRKN